MYILLIRHGVSYAWSLKSSYSRTQMSRVYDNWERLVRATLRREDLRLSGERTPSDLSSASASASPSPSPSPSRRLSSFNLTSFLSLAAGLGQSFEYSEILRATYYFNESNLLRHGHSGDFFLGVLQDKTEIVVKKINLSSFETESLFISELEVLGKVPKSNRLVPCLGYCLENEYEKFLVYKYMPNRDLSSSFYRKIIDTDGLSSSLDWVTRMKIATFYSENVAMDDDDDGLPSLDWITRMKIATGTADALSNLHHDCFPPFVHGDIQASSILLDECYEVRLGSLTQVDVQESRTDQRQMNPRHTISEQGSSGASNATCAYDVYCFGKVLLELVTGKIGISASNDAATKDWLEQTLPYITIYDKDLVTSIVDPSLIIDEDLLEEVFAMAVIARSCLNPRPSRRPLMRYVLKALENPLMVVREEHKR